MVMTAFKGSLCSLVLVCALVMSTTLGSASQGLPDRIDGQDILSMISKNKGKVVLINFWATWCSACRQEIKELQSVRQAFSQKQLVIAGIAMDDQSSLQAYLRKRPVSYPIYSAEPDVKYLFSISGVPKTMVYDRQGQLALKRFGYVPDRRLRELIRSLLEAE